MLSYYVIYYEMFKKVKQRIEKVALNVFQNSLYVGLAMIIRTKIDK